MAVFLFRIVDSAMDEFYVRGEGADVDTARTDATNKWTTWAAANSPGPDELEARQLGPDAEVICVGSDDPACSPTPWANYVE